MYMMRLLAASDLSNQSVVGHHHGYWSEESLQVVWQFRPARIARVHGDEGRTRRYQLNLPALEHKPGQLGYDPSTKSSGELEPRPKDVFKDAKVHL